MGELTNKAMGKTKKAVGKATGDRDLEGRGRMQETTGKVQGGVRKAGDKINEGIDKVARKVGEARSQRPKTTSRPTDKGTVTRRTTTTTTVEEDV